MKGSKVRGGWDRAGLDGEISLRTVGSGLPVNSRYEILTKQLRLYEKCTTTSDELTSEADRGRRQGLVSDWSVCVCVLGCGCTLQRKVKPH